MEIKEYKTVNGFASAQITEKKSRFIANAANAENEEQAREFIACIKKKYYDARHNCYAYIVGENGECQKFSDDGEPASTAGKPIFDVLKGCCLTNTVVVVTRYFGGILLGTGGLVRAYGKSARLAVESAGIAQMMLIREVLIKCDYSLLGKLQYEISQKGHIINDIIYTDKAELTVICKYDEAESFAKNIINTTNTAAECFIKEKRFVKIVDGKIIQ